MKSQVDTYRQIVGNLLSHTQVWSEITEGHVRNSLITAESLIYKQLRNDLLASDPGRESDRSAKEAHNASVMALRESHLVMRKKILRSRLYRPSAA